MKRVLASLLAIAMVMSALPVAAEKASGAATSTPLQAAVREAGPKVTLTAAPVAAASAQVPVSLPRSGSGRVRKQGRGGAGMAIGLVTSLVGVAATVYMVKQMKKDSDSRNQ